MLGETWQQSAYFENPAKVANFKLNAPFADESDMRSQLLDLLNFPCESVFATATARAEDLTMVPLSGGLTNLLYVIKDSKAPANSPALVVRVFGEGTDSFMDRNKENVIFSSLSKLGAGGPTFYGLFENGRVEGFLDRRTLDFTEMANPGIYTRVMAATSKFHASGKLPLLCDNEALDKSVGLWSLTDRCIQLSHEFNAEVNGAHDATLLVSLKDFEQEARYLRQELQEQASACVEMVASCGEKGEELPLETLAQCLAYETVLVHSDLLPGNMLIDKSVDTTTIPNTTTNTNTNSDIVFIDYEYSSMGYRAYDLGNHFNEHCGCDGGEPRDLYPGEKVRFPIIRQYLDSCAQLEADSVEVGPLREQWARWTALRGKEGKEEKEGKAAVEAVEEVVRAFDRVCTKFSMAAGALWTFWTILQIKMSKIEFDYVEYAALRLRGYLFLRESFWPEARLLEVKKL